MVEEFDPYHTWLGISKKEQPPNHYRLLAIDLFEKDATVIQHAADRQMSHLRTFQTGRHGALSQKLLNEVAAARVCLLHPTKKAEYDARLKEQTAVHVVKTAEPLEEEEDSAEHLENVLTEVIGSQPIHHHSTSHIGRHSQVGKAGKAAPAAPPVAGQFEQLVRENPGLMIGAGIALLCLLLGVGLWIGLSASKPQGSQQAATNHDDSSKSQVADPKKPIPSAKAEKPAVARGPREIVEVLLPPYVRRDTSVLIDGKPFELPPRGDVQVPLPPGDHEFAFSRPGFLPKKEKVSVAAGKTERIMPILEPDPNAPKPKPEHPAGEKPVGEKPAPEKSGVAKPAGEMPAEKPAEKLPAEKTPTEKPAEKPVEKSPTAKPPMVGRAPVPDAAACAAAMKVAQEIFKDDYDNAANNPTAMSELAQRILQKADEIQGDSVSRYAFLRLAGEVGMKGGDAAVPFAAIDRMCEHFEMEPWDAKIAILNDWVKHPKKGLDRKVVAAHALTATKDAIDRDQYAAAEQLARLAIAEAGKAENKEMVDQAKAVQKQIEPAKRGYAKVEAAIASLKEKPDDPESNGIVGRHWCLIKDAWPKGLPFLAKGGDSAMKAAAEAELAALKPAEPNAPGLSTDDKLKLGDNWWDLAAKAEGREKEGLLLRAGHWYQQAIGGVENDVTRIKIDKRMESIGKVNRAAAGGATRQIVNSFGMKFVPISAGEFMMGARDAEIAAVEEDMKARSESTESALKALHNAAPQHSVRLSKPFYLGVCEVTQGEYERVIGANPSYFSVKNADLSKEMAKTLGSDTGRLPVENVSWEDAVKFCQKLSGMPLERAARRSYRLPTEAEWEYACRAGCPKRWSCGDDPVALVEFAWFRENAKTSPRPVGQRRANVWGLFDMHGNVGEWCSDGYLATYYEKSPPVDPPGYSPTVSRTVRGGSFYAAADGCRSASRRPEIQTERSRYIGFRLALTVE